MGSRYLTDLAGLVRSLGITTIEESGWQTRARSSGGYDSGRPDHVMVHHTASNPATDGQSDVDYMCHHSKNKPIANLYLNRSGKVWIMAGGATNTNGKGTCPHCGTTDNMNARAIGIEAANNGVGEPWPTIQQDVYNKLVGGLCGHYTIPNAAVIAHFEYAPDRKIDPAGQSRYASGGNKWNMHQFRFDSSPSGPSPQPLPTGGDLVAIAIQSKDGSNEQKFATFSLVPGVLIGWLTSQTQIDVGVITGTLVMHGDTGTPLKNFGASEIQDMINRYWAGGPVPPGFKQPATDT